MRTLYLQPFSGVSGDMFLGALVDLGVSIDDLRRGLLGLGLEGWALEAREERRGPFRATRLRVRVAGLPESTADGAGPAEGHPAPAHGHPHAPPHDHGHPHGHAHEQEHGRTGTGHERRGLEEILTIIGSSELPAPVREQAARVFRRLGEAEARVHGIAVAEVHFHEVGALDSIVDIVGSCLAVHLLGIRRIVSGPVALGSGFVDVAHGRIPLPAPAALELLRGRPVEHREVGFELTTPTGAALLATLSERFGPMPPLRLAAVGYGAGDDRPGPVPNVLRAILGESSDDPVAASPGAAAPAPSRGRPLNPISDSVVVLETTVDDMTPQLLADLMDRLLEAGALDVTVQPVVMKKSRPGHEVRVLVPPDAEPALVSLLFRESTTLGIRRHESARWVLERSVRAVDTPWGRVRVKIGHLGDEVLTRTPEYDDLREVARRARVPIKEVQRVAQELAASLPPAEPREPGREA